MKKFLIALTLFLIVTVSLLDLTGATFAKSLDSTPATPIATAVAIPTDYATVLSDLHYGKGYCFFDGSFKTTNPTSCDTNVKPPPLTPFPGCSDVNTGGVLSPNLAHVDFAGGIGYLFQSQQCGMVWSGTDDQVGSHVVDWVEVREVGTNRSQFEYLGGNRPTNAGDWTSTYGMSYVPGGTYCIDAAVDGTTLPEQCATV